MEIKNAHDFILNQKFKNLVLQIVGPNESFHPLENYRYVELDTKNKNIQFNGCCHGNVGKDSVRTIMYKNRIKIHLCGVQKIRSYNQKYEILIL